MAGVGKRLRWVRRSLGMSMGDVSRLSGHRWSASVLGYYERGTRAMPASTLRELADFYGVSSSYLLGESELRPGRPGGEASEVGIVLHLPTLATDPQASPIDRMARRIAAARGHAATDWLAVRSTDLRAMAAALGMAPSATIERLRRWGCRVTEAPA